MRRLTLPLWTVPFAFLGVTLAAYGLFAAQQGYHWDDWGFAWVGHYIGREGLDAYFAITRPVWSNLFVATTSLIGPNPFEWQVFGLAARWLMAVALWWTLRLTWPRQERFAFVAALLFLVYPGFGQHSIALVYGHYSLTFALFFVSLALGLWAMRAERLRWLMILGGAILSALHLFSVEYYFGLELLRPILMWIVAGEVAKGWPRVWRALRFYIPFGAVVAAYGLWRLFGFQSEVYSVGAFSLADAARSVWSASVGAWSRVLRVPPFEEMGTRLAWVYAVILLASLAGMALFVARMRQEAEAALPESERRPIWGWFGLGVAAVLLAGVPFFAAGLQVKLNFPSDRFTQPFAFGAALILAASLELLPRLSWRALAAGMLAALAIGVQIQNAFAFREDWRAQENYFWQLAWRAPALKEGTVIVTERAPFTFTDDDALTFGLNWLYAPEYAGGNLNFAQVFLATRPNLLETPAVEWHLLSTDFISTTDSMLILQFEPNSCLRILHPTYDAHLPLAPLSEATADSLAEAGYPLMRQGVREALPFSNMSQVIAAQESARPPEVIFGAEPPHQWCWYFEKADLARANGDWAEAARLGDEASAASFRPNNLSEWLPFIEAYARLGRVKDAKKLTLETARQMPALAPALCAVWQRVEAEAFSEADQIQARHVQSDLQYCPVENGNE